MNYHREALEEHDESVKKALSNIDQETLAKTKEILNSKEFKKSFHNTNKPRNFRSFILSGKKWLAFNILALLSLLITAAAFIKSFF